MAQCKICKFEGDLNAMLNHVIKEPKKNKYCCECNSCIKNAIKEHPKTHIHSYCGEHTKERVFPKRISFRGII